jgi:hypothetical protein
MFREVNGREAVKETRRILELAGFRGKIEGAVRVLVKGVDFVYRH